MSSCLSPRLIGRNITDEELIEIFKDIPTKDQKVLEDIKTIIYKNAKIRRCLEFSFDKDSLKKGLNDEVQSSEEINTLIDAIKESREVNEEHLRELSELIINKTTDSNLIIDICSKNSIKENDIKSILKDLKDNSELRLLTKEKLDIEMDGQSS